VSAADKLHNLRCILSDWKSIGEQLWKRFNATKQDHLWYYSELSSIFDQRKPDSFVTDELRLHVMLLRQVVEAVREKN